MKYSQQTGFILAILVIAVCWMPWVTIESKSIVINGFHAEGTRFGKPGIMVAFFSAIAAILFLVPKIWAKRINVFIAAFAFAWTLRNYLILSTCFGGECPQKQVGLYLMVLLSGLMLLMSFLPKIKIAN